ncbi:MAG: Galactokinase, partial [Bacteroidota bacterium]
MIVSTPGRICLFGEHQDYLGLPIIAAAISKRIQVKGIGKLDGEFIIHLPDIQKIEKFELDFPLEYKQDRDYFKSILNVLNRKGHQISYGLELEVKGNIPINSGTSSSSALNVSFLNFLNHEFNLGYNSQEIGELAYEAEVLEFGEPGGMMDQYSTAIGNVIYLASVPKIKIDSFSKKLGTFVLGDSLEPKDTLGILSRVKYGTLAGLEKIQKEFPDFSIHKANISDLEKVKGLLSEDEYILIKSNISDRDLLINALDLFEGNKD